MYVLQPFILFLFLHYAFKAYIEYTVEAFMQNSPVELLAHDKYIGASRLRNTLQAFLSWGLPWTAWIGVVAYPLAYIVFVAYNLWDMFQRSMITWNKNLKTYTDPVCNQMRVVTGNAIIKSYSPPLSKLV